MHVERIEEYFKDTDNLAKMKVREACLDYVFVDKKEEFIIFIFKIDYREFRVNIDIATTYPATFRISGHNFDVEHMLKEVKWNARMESVRIKEMKEEQQKDFEELDEIIKDI